METTTHRVRINERSNDKMTELQSEPQGTRTPTSSLQFVRTNTKKIKKRWKYKNKNKQTRYPAENIQVKKKPKSQLQASFQFHSSSTSSSASPSPSSSQLRKKVEVKTEEGKDVCFVCYDGGDLVLCYPKSCTKAYHPTCVARDEGFFQTKGPWTCGMQCHSLFLSRGFPAKGFKWAAKQGLDPYQLTHIYATSTFHFISDRERKNLRSRAMVSVRGRQGGGCSFNKAQLLKTTLFVTK